MGCWIRTLAWPLGRTDVREIEGPGSCSRSFFLAMSPSCRMLQLVSANERNTSNLRPSLTTTNEARSKYSSRAGVLLGVRGITSFNSVLLVYPSCKSHGTLFWNISLWYDCFITKKAFLVSGNCHSRASDLLWTFCSPCNHGFQTISNRCLVLCRICFTLVDLRWNCVIALPLL